LIEKVELIDFFDKEEWIDKRSVAFRVWVSHPEKTLEREEIEDVRQIALKSIEKLGAKLR
jgi:phenylalanyl-tRNA synthetase beta subunit